MTLDALYQTITRSCLVSALPWNISMLDQSQLFGLGSPLEHFHATLEMFV